ncbi:MAG TPA: hypothetical protein VGM60_13435 [Pseudonocardia sp.]|jgi:hypothetical protein|uniref:hypothetical protein n=1 Tax=Pseudonocardia sp. TaxID=60912 RepID=UPI002F3F1E55
MVTQPHTRLDTRTHRAAPLHAGPSGADPDTASGEPASPGWVDHLVELHVLAEHGDAASAAAAEQWIAKDMNARQLWESVERLRDQLRDAPVAVIGRPDGGQRRHIDIGLESIDLVRRQLDDQRDEQEETVLDIKEICEQHSEALTAIQLTLTRHGELIEQQNQLLAAILRGLD